MLVMNGKMVSAITLTLLLTSLLTLAFNIQPVKASGTIYIRADGSIEPSDAPIITYDNITYTFTDNTASYTDGIVVERDNIVIDGVGHTLQGTLAPPYIGIILNGRRNVTIKNMEIKRFDLGLWLNYSSHNTFSGNNITNNVYGVWLNHCFDNSLTGNNITANNVNGIGLDSSSSNSLIGNNITANENDGIFFYGSFNNNLTGNNITANNQHGINLHDSSNNSLTRNNIVANNRFGIWLDSSNNNSFSENDITINNEYGIYHYASSGNEFYHNNFIKNTNQVFSSDSVNVWDDGYPFGGNFWSDYAGVDVKSGPGQNLPGSDGLGDTLYIIDVTNVDHYPLMNPYGAPPPPAYTLTIATTDGGTTDAAPGTYSYTANSLVQVTAIQNAGYLSDHWELDSVDVGSANPYTVLMDKDHVLKAVFSPIPKPPVGGYSLSIEGCPTTAKQLTPYLTLIAILAIGFTTIRRKASGKTK